MGERAGAPRMTRLVRVQRPRDIEVRRLGAGRRLGWHGDASAAAIQTGTAKRWPSRSRIARYAARTELRRNTRPFLRAFRTDGRVFATSRRRQTSRIEPCAETSPMIDRAADEEPM